MAAKDGRLAAAVRVLPRTIAVGGRAVAALGIGDVCTHPDFRRQGAIKQVFDSIVKGWDTGSGCPPDAARIVAVLHAAPGVHGLYAKYGFKEVPAEYGWLPCPAPMAPAKPGPVPSTVVPGAVVRPAALPDDVDALHALAAEFNAGLDGVHVRSKVAWQHWVPYVVGASGLWVLATGATIHAFVSVRYKYELTTLSDVGVADGVPALDAVNELLPAAVHACWGGAAPPATVKNDDSGAGAGASASTDAAASGANLRVPHPVLRRLLGDGCPPPEPELRDVGWMYRDIRRPEGEPSIVEQLQASESHMVYITDFF